MKSHTDKYNLDEKSTTGMYGFETFLRKEDGLYYFHFNDPGGGAALYSQGYSKALSRNNGIQSVLKNAPIEDRYEIYKDGSRYYFVLKAGNHQEIARSRFEEGFREINDLKDKCMTIGNQAQINERQPVAEKSAAAPTPSDMGTTSAPKKSKEVGQAIPSPRYTFNVRAYKSNGRVKIVHVLSGQSKVMQGVSGKQMEQFIFEHLPNEWKEKFNGSAGKRVIGASPSETTEKAQPKRMVFAESGAEADPLPNTSPKSIYEMENIIEKAKAEDTLTLNGPVLKKDTKKEKEEFSFARFLERGSEMPEGSPVDFSVAEVMEVLRTPASKTVAEPPQESDVNRFINSRSRGNDKRYPTGDIVKTFIGSSESAASFASRKRPNKDFEIRDLGGQNASTVFEEDEKPKDVVMEYILNNKKPSGPSSERNVKKQEELAAAVLNSGKITARSLDLQRPVPNTATKPCQTCS